GDAFDVVKYHLAVDRLSDVHAALTIDADRPVAQEMAEQASEREGTEPCFARFHRKQALADTEDVPVLVLADLIERRFESDEDSVAPELELVRANPPTIRAEDLVVRCTHECPTILQDERNAVAESLIHLLG